MGGSEFSEPQDFLILGALFEKKNSNLQIQIEVWKSIFTENIKRNHIKVLL